jgi:hypothetical protein
MRREEVVEDTQNGARLIDNDEARASASNDDWRPPMKSHISFLP